MWLSSKSLFFGPSLFLSHWDVMSFCVQLGKRNNVVTERNLGFGMELLIIGVKRSSNVNISLMIVIHCKYNSVLLLRAGQLGELVKHTSRLEENKLVSN